jgi:hypothetical protein
MNGTVRRSIMPKQAQRSVAPKAGSKWLVAGWVASCAASLLVGRVCGNQGASVPAAAAGGTGEVQPIGAAVTEVDRRSRLPPPRLDQRLLTEAAGEERRLRAAGSMRTLLTRVKLSPFHGQGKPELAVNVIQDYLVGWATALQQGAPELLPEVAAQVTEEMCRPDASAEAVIALAKLAQQVPALTKAAALDCVFRRSSKEDVVLWSALDAWRASGMLPTPEIKKLQASATDERTRRRFLSHEQEIAVRTAANRSNAMPATQGEHQEVSGRETNTAEGERNAQ